MSQSLADVLLHYVFTTKHRHSWITPEIEPELFKYIIGLCRELESPIIEIKNTENHVHISLRVNKSLSMCQFISGLKSNDSKWIKTKEKNYCHFTWKQDYGAVAVTRSLEPVEKSV